MSRPSDWSALGLYEDPVPGSPSAVEDGAAQMLLVASTISEAAENLRSIAAMEGQESLAVEAFRERAREVAAEIELVRERYAQTGEALVGYVGPLREAQQWSVEALEAAVAARDRLAAAELDVLEATNDLYAADDDGRSAAQESLTDAQGRRSLAESDLADARTRLYAAIDHRDGAAEAAMGLIDSALEVNGLDDSAWRQFLNRNADFLGGVAEVLGWVGAGLAIVVLFVPGLNLLALGVALGVGALAINFALAENGNKGWGDFAMDAFGLATLGAGRLATSLFRLGRAGNAARAASGRARAMRGARPQGPRRGGGRYNNEKQLRRQRRQRNQEIRTRWTEGGRARQRAEYDVRTAVPQLSRNPVSLVHAVRDNVSRNGFWGVVRAGGGDAYQMSYYNLMREAGGGQAAAAVYRADFAAGMAGLAETGVSVAGPILNRATDISTWAGDLVAPVMEGPARSTEEAAAR